MTYPRKVLDLVRPLAAKTVNPDTGKPYKVSDFMQTRARNVIVLRKKVAHTLFKKNKMTIPEIAEAMGFSSVVVRGYVDSDFAAARAFHNSRDRRLANKQAKNAPRKAAKKNAKTTGRKTSKKQASKAPARRRAAAAKPATEHFDPLNI